MDAFSLSGWDGASVALKACLYGTVFAGAGGVLFLTACGQALILADRRRIERLIGIALLLAVVLSGLRIPLLAGSLSGQLSGMFDASLLDMVLQSEERRATLVRVGGLVLASAALSVSRARGWQALATAGAALAVTSFAWAGHAHALPRAPAAIALHALHLLCVAFWLGALLPLWLIARADPRGPRTAAAASTFGRVAVAMVCALLTAGALLLWGMLSSDGTLRVEGDYARLAFGKVALAAAMLSLAAYNKLRLTPRLLEGDATAVRVLARTVWAEVFFAALILLATAALTTLLGPPALE
jgi:putative copper export protein